MSLISTAGSAFAMISPEMQKLMQVEQVLHGGNSGIVPPQQNQDNLLEQLGLGQGSVLGNILQRGALGADSPGPLLRGLGQRLENVIENAVGNALKEMFGGMLPMQSDGSSGATGDTRDIDGLLQQPFRIGTTVMPLGAETIGGAINHNNGFGFTAPESGGGIVARSF